MGRGAVYHLVIGGIGYARMVEIKRFWPGRAKLQKIYNPWSLLHYVFAQELREDHRLVDPFGRYPGRLEYEGASYCDSVVEIRQSWNMEAVLIAARYGRRMRRRQREHGKKLV